MLYMVVSYIVELALLWTPVWRLRKYLLPLSALLIGIGLGSLLVSFPASLTIPLSFLAAYRLGNMLRVAEARMHENYLKRAARRTSGSLLLLQMAVAILWLMIHDVHSGTLLSALAGAQVLVAVGIACVTVRNVRKTRFRPPTAFLSDKEMPTVTVAIPARNETTDLEECIRTVLASDYPKLEVLVLDDCSHKETADIIKSFAHDGVRFIKGAEPSERWLAKNQAYERLYKEASGEIIIFFGVDVRIGKSTVRSAVNFMRSRGKRMLSVLPVRDQADPMLAIIQPMRYWWELALPRVLFNRPPVLSTFWAIERKSLRKLGGFSGVSHNLLPEGVFARELIKSNGYTFMRSGGDIVVLTVKSLVEQRATALRMRYPQLRRRPELQLLLSVATATFLFGPFALIIFAVMEGMVAAALLAAVAYGILVIVHSVIVSITNAANKYTALLNLPLAILTELALSYESMYKYEFSDMDWKGRNICLPVMHAIRRLPKV